MNSNEAQWCPHSKDSYINICDCGASPLYSYIPLEFLWSEPRRRVFYFLPAGVYPDFPLWRKCCEDKCAYIRELRNCLGMWMSKHKVFCVCFCLFNLHKSSLKALTEETDIDSWQTSRILTCTWSSKWSQNKTRKQPRNIPSVVVQSAHCSCRWLWLGSQHPY